MKQSVLPRLALLALIWGSSFLWIKLADRGFPPVEVTFARLALGAAVLLPVVLARRAEVPRSAVAIVLGVLVLGETVTAAALAGIALVLAGVALTRRRERKWPPASRLSDRPGSDEQAPIRTSAYTWSIGRPRPLPGGREHGGAR